MKFEATERHCPVDHLGDGLPVSTTLEDGAAPGLRAVGAASGAAAWEEGATLAHLEQGAVAGAGAERADAAALLADGAATTVAPATTVAAGEKRAAGHDCGETCTGVHCSRRLGRVVLDAAMFLSALYVKSWVQFLWQC